MEKNESEEEGKHEEGQKIEKNQNLDLACSSSANGDDKQENLIRKQSITR